MLYVDEILYRKITPADFKNIENVKKPSGGGGQTYIDLSGIEVERVIEFCSAGTELLKPAAKYYDGVRCPAFRLKVVAIGTTREAPLKIDCRRKNNYRICEQAQHQYRHPAWTAAQGFPTITGKGMPFETKRSYPDDVLDPIVNPIVEKLSIYIVRTVNGHYFAGYIYGDAIPETWPRDAGLQRLLSANWEDVKKEEGRGVYKPPILLEFLNSREGTFKK